MRVPLSSQYFFVKMSLVTNNFQTLAHTYHLRLLRHPVSLRQSYEPIAPSCLCWFEDFTGCLASANATTPYVGSVLKEQGYQALGRNLRQYS